MSLAELLAGDRPRGVGGACPSPAGRPRSGSARRPGWSPGACRQVGPVRLVPPGWGPVPRPGWGYYPPSRRRRPELGGATVLILVTVLIWLAAPHARSVRGMVAGGLPQVPALQLPKLSQPPAAPDRGPAAQAPKGLTYTIGAGCRPAGDFASPRLDR